MPRGFAVAAALFSCVSLNALAAMDDHVALLQYGSATTGFVDCRKKSYHERCSQYRRCVTHEGQSPNLKAKNGSECTNGKHQVCKVPPNNYAPWGEYVSGIEHEDIAKWDVLFHCAQFDKGNGGSGFDPSSAMLSNTQGHRTKDTLHVQYRSLNARGVVVRDAASAQVNNECHREYFNKDFVPFTLPACEKCGPTCKNVRVKGFMSTPNVYSTMLESEVAANMQTTGAVVFMINHKPCKRPSSPPYWYVLMLAEDCPLSWCFFN